MALYSIPYNTKCTIFNTRERTLHNKYTILYTNERTLHNTVPNTPWQQKVPGEQNPRSWVRKHYYITIRIYGG